MMKKVLFVATVVKTHIMQFHIPYLKMFKDMGWETAVCARNDYENPDECAIPYCDAFYDLPFERFPLKRENLKVYKELKKIIDAGHYDIVHCHTPMGAMLARLAAKEARRNGTKVIYTAHGFHFFKGAPLVNWLLYYPAERFLAGYTDVLITINDEDYAAAKKFKVKKLYYVPGVGVDLSRFGQDEAARIRKRREYGIGEKDIVVLTVGEATRNKNHGMAIKAFAELGIPNCYYVICGGGACLEENKKTAHSLGVQDSVIFTGYRTDIPDFYKMADIFLLPSLREGLPVALMEAMASGLPSVCYKIRGNSDLIEDGVTGIFAENTPQSLAAAISALAEDGEMRRRLGQKAQEAVQRFDLKNTKAEMKKIYMDEEG